MKTYQPEKPLISIHIPKCGGTTISQVLKAWFKDRLFLHYFDEKCNRKPRKHPLDPGICIHGHFNRRRGFGIRDYYPDVDQFVTLVRDPFEILVSRFFFTKKLESEKKNFRDGAEFGLESDVNEYLERETYNKEYTPNIMDYMPADMNLSNFREVIESRFVYIGLLEDISYSIEAMSKKLGFELSRIHRLNSSARFQDVSDSVRKKFIDNHPFEFEIFDYVRNNYRKW